VTQNATLADVFELTEDAYVAALAWTWSLERDGRYLSPLKRRAIAMAEDAGDGECFDRLVAAVLGLEAARVAARTSARLTRGQAVSKLPV